MKVDLITILLFLSTIFSFLGSYVGWKQRRKPSAIPISLLCLLAGAWALFYMFEYSSPNLQTKLFWLVVKFPAVAFLPVTVAAFILRFAGWLDWPSKRTLAIVSVIPVLTIIITFTNPLHHLFWKNYTLEQHTGFTGLELTYGFWFWVHVTYSYGIIVISTIVALISLGRTLHIYRRQITLLAIGVLIPFMGSVVSVFELHPWHGLDISPITFGISALFLLSTTRLASILNVVPLAHSALLEQLRDGLMVLNNQGVVLELNHSAENIIALSRQDVLGKNIHDLDHPAFRILHQTRKDDTLRHEIRLDTEAQAHWYDTRISTIFTESGFAAGRMVIWHEITNRKQVEDKLRYASTHDQLTSIYNRVYFDEKFERIARIGPWPVAIIMLDIDNLKKTNDLYGHATGDKLIIHAAKVLRSTFRQDDVVARIGGDEFAIIIPRCNENNIEKLVLRLREAITQPLDLLLATKLEFSIGFAIANNLEELQSAKNKADQEMYADKNRRKNK